MCSPRSFVSFRALVALGIAGTGLAAGSAHAILGSFSPAYGYDLSLPYNDVTYYNAGAFGPFAGGGPGPTPIAADSGNWRLISSGGAFFPNAAARNAAVSGAPPYPSSVVGIPVYIVGNHFGGRTDNSALAFRNDQPLGTVGRAVYDYSIDTYDTGGVAPNTITSGTVSHEIYFFSNPADPVNPGTRSPNKFGLGYRDTAGNIGLEWGYARDNEIQWRAGAGPWNYTGIYANAAYDGMRVNIDLTSQKFGIDYYNANLNTWSTLVPFTTSLGATMSNLTGLRWGLEDGVNTGIGGKNFFDDSSFVIPTPGAAGLLGLGALALGRRRR